MTSAGHTRRQSTSVGLLLLLWVGLLAAAGCRQGGMADPAAPEKFGRLTLAVQNLDGKPIPGAVVSIVNGHGQSYDVLTDAKGTIRGEGLLSENPYLLRVSAPGYGTGEIAGVALVADREISKTLRLTPDPHGGAGPFALGIPRLLFSPQQAPYGAPPPAAALLETAERICALYAARGDFHGNAAKVFCLDTIDEELELQKTSLLADLAGREVKDRAKGVAGLFADTLRRPFQGSAPALFAEGSDSWAGAAYLHLSGVETVEWRGGKALAVLLNWGPRRASTRMIQLWHPLVLILDDANGALLDSAFLEGGEGKRGPDAWGLPSDTDEKPAASAVADIVGQQAPPLHLFLYYRGSANEYEGVAEVRVYSGDSRTEPLQVIDLGPCQRSYSPDQERLFLEDINGDCHPDLLFLTYWGVTGNENYSAWLYHPELKRFALSEAYSEVLQTIKGFSADEFLDTSAGDMRSRHSARYRMGTESPTLVESEMAEADEKEERWIVTVQKWAEDGTFTTTTSTLPASEGPGF